MWRWLRGRRFSGYKFRPEHPVGRYFLDFYCEEASLSIELDGSGHGHPDQQVHDGETNEISGDTRNPGTAFLEPSFEKGQ